MRNNSVDDGGVPSGRRLGRAAWVWAVLFCIVLVGLGLRLRNLDRECPWYDEFITCEFLDAPSLPAFVGQIRSYNEPVAPLYPSLEYLWADVFNCSWYGLRILSVLLGLLTIIAVFDLGAVLFGPVAGLLAALAVALNATQIYYSQEIRMYALSGLLAVLSMRSFVAFLDRRDRRTLALNVLVNLLLVWNHPIALMLPFVQGLHLLAFKRKEWKDHISWGVLQGLVAVSIVVWATGRDYGRVEAQMHWLQAPQVFGLREYEPSLQSFFMFVMGTRIMLEARWIALVPPLAALLYGWTVWRGQTGAADAATRTPREVAGLLLGWLVVPLAAMFILSHVCRPCFTERYLIFLTYPVYVILGALATFVRRPAFKTLGIVAVVLVVAQSALVLPQGPFRRAFSGLAAHVREHSKPGDAVLIRPDWLYETEFQHYLGRKDLVVEKMESREDFRQRADRALARGAAVWVVGAQDPPVCPMVVEMGYKCTGKLWPGASPLQLVYIPRR